MDISEHLVVLRAEGALMASVVKLAGLDAPVPTCPDWTTRDLVKHLGGVHRWATAFVARALTEPGDVNFEDLMKSLPDDAGLLDWFVDGHGALVHALASADPDLRCWTFMAAPSPLAFWARRQAHETAIHRVDAQLAAHLEPSACTPTFSADGIDEFLTGFITRRAKVTGDAASTFGVRCLDADGEWLVRVGPEDLTTERHGGVADADCRASGLASDLFFTLWNRRAASGLTVEGDDAALRKFLSATRIQWD